MARRLRFDMFPSGVDDRVLRRGDECDRLLIESVLGNIDGEMDEDEPILQNENAWSQHFIGNTRLYHTFSRGGNTEPYTYSGLCAFGENGNMHPDKSQKVYIISQYHSEDAAEQEFNIRFAKALARNLFLDFGDIPVMPHLYFPTFMHDFGFERDFGIAAGHLMMDLCDNAALAMIDGRMSEGMKADLEHATVDLGMRPKIMNFTMAQAKDYVVETEREADAERSDRSQH